MAKYSKSASEDVERAMKRRKSGKLKSGKGGKGGTVKSRKQAIAIGLSEARAEGKKVPKKKAGKKTAKKTEKEELTGRRLARLEAAMFQHRPDIGILAVKGAEHRAV